MFKIEGSSNCLVGSRFQSPPLFFRNRHPPWLRIFPVSSSTTHQFPGNLKDGAWNEKKNITRNLHKEQKLHLASFFPVEKEKVVELRPVPLPASTPRHCYPLRNYTEYSTSRFVLLHLNCKTRGRGTEIRIYQVYTEYDSLWVHTEIRGNS